MDAFPPDALGIAELADRAGVTPRTVRYYVAEGLLPPPSGAGQRRVYLAEHLSRLRAIRRLKEAYLPLGEIRRRLSELAPDELDRLAADEAAVPTSALEYLAGIQSPSPARHVHEPRPSAMPPTMASAGPPLASLRPAEPAHLAAHPSEQTTGLAETASGAPAETIWHRASLAPGVELHYQRTGDRRRDDVIAHLIRAAVHLLDTTPARETPET